MGDYERCCLCGVGIVDHDIWPRYCSEGCYEDEEGTYDANGNLVPHASLDIPGYVEDVDEDDLEEYLDDPDGYIERLEAATKEGAK